MAVAFRDAGAIVSGTGGVTVSSNASHALNDIDLLFVETPAQEPFLTTPNGFVEVTGGNATIGTGGEADATDLTVFWRRWNGVAGDPVIQNVADHIIAIVLHYTGCITSGNPINVAGNNTNAATNDATITGVTTTVDACGVVSAITGALPDAVGTTEFSSFTNAGLASITETSDNTRADGNGGAIGTAFGLRTTAGATGSTIVTSATSTEKAAVMIALLPTGPVGKQASTWWGAMGYW